MAHARAKLTVLGRQLLVNRVLIDGWKPADAAKAMGVYAPDRLQVAAALP